MARDDWQEPKNKTMWLSDLVDASEAVIVGYEKYLMDQISHQEMASLMTNLRRLVPMDLKDKLSGE